MKNNTISKICNTIREEQSQSNDITFSIGEINKILDVEKIRKEQIEKQISVELKNNENRTLLERVDEIILLEKHLTQINKNISKLEELNEVLEQKKDSL